MIDPVLLRENPELVKRSQEARGSSADTVDAALEADRVRRTAIATFEQLRELMQWKRDGLLTDAEFQQAKEKILREEPDHEYACMSPGVPHRSLATRDMTREGGGESVRVFGILIILEPILVHQKRLLLKRVLGK